MYLAIRDLEWTVWLECRGVSEPQETFLVKLTLIDLWESIVIWIENSLKDDKQRIVMNERRRECHWG